MDETQAERLKIAAATLAEAENLLMRARKNYRRALKAFDDAGQVRLDEKS